MSVDFMGFDSEVFASLLRGDHPVLIARDSVNWTSLQSLAIYMPRLWATPGSSAMAAIEALVAAGLPVQARAMALEHHGLMELAKRPWGDEEGKVPVTEALARVDRWVALGGSLEDEIQFETVCSLMPRGHNTAHIHALLARGAPTMVNGLPLVMKIAQWHPMSELLALLNSPAPVDVNWRSATAKTPFHAALAHGVAQWCPGERGGHVLAVLAEVVEAWVRRGGDLWAGRLAATARGPLATRHSDVELLCGPLARDDLPAWCKNSGVMTAEREKDIRAFNQAWLALWEPRVKAMLDADFNQRDQDGVHSLRGLWLSSAYLRSTDEVRRRVLDFPVGRSVFVPLPLRSKLSTPVDAWLATFLVHAKSVTLPDQGSHTNGQAWQRLLATELKKSPMGAVIQNEFVAHQRQKQTLTRSPVPSSPSRRPRA